MRGVGVFFFWLWKEDKDAELGALFFLAFQITQHKLIVDHQTQFFFFQGIYATDCVTLQLFFLVRNFFKIFKKWGNVSPSHVFPLCMNNFSSVLCAHIYIYM